MGYYPCPITSASIISDIFPQNIKINNNKVVTGERKMRRPTIPISSIHNMKLNTLPYIVKKVLHNNQQAQQNSVGITAGAKTRNKIKNDPD